MLNFLCDRNRRDDGGSVMIAMVIIVLCTGALVMLLAAVDSGLNRAESDERRTDAFQYANAGMDHAVYRLDRAVLPATASADGKYVPYLDASGRVYRFTDRYVSGNNTYDIAAEQDPPGQDARWRVVSTGTEPGGRKRTAVATVQAELLFQDGFFTVNNFNITGNSGTPQSYDSDASPDASTLLPLPIPTTLGTNGLIGGSGIALGDNLWGGYVMYGRPTEGAAEADCDGCSADKVSNVTDAKQIAVPPVPTTALPCPNGGDFGLTTNGSVPDLGDRPDGDSLPDDVYIIPPGDYTCPTITFHYQYPVVVGGSADGTVRIWPTTQLTNTRHGNSLAIINRNQPSWKFQMFFPEPPVGSPESNMCDVDIWALMYTPGLTLGCSGEHQLLVHGAVMSKLYEGSGAHFNFYYDTQSLYRAHNGLFKVKDWRECAPEATNC